LTMAVVATLLLAAGTGTAGAAHQIDSCADDVTSSGLHVINDSINDGTASSCIDITASDVVLDGQGNTVDGLDGDSGSVGVNVMAFTTLDNVTVRNLTATNWDNGVIYQDANNGAVTDVDSTGNSGRGMEIDSSTGNTVELSNFTQNGNNGVTLLGASKNNLTDNNISENGNHGLTLFGTDTIL